MAEKEAGIVLRRPAVLVYDDFGQFAALSNDFLSPFLLDDITWKSAEHYYQSAKFYERDHVDAVRSCPTGEDVRQLVWGRLDAFVRPDWDLVRVGVMHRALLSKFETNERARSLLLSTWPLPILEDSETDGFWGIGDGLLGENVLGRLLARVRRALLGVDDDETRFHLAARPVHNTTSRLETLEFKFFVTSRQGVPKEKRKLQPTALTSSSIDNEVESSLVAGGLSIPSPDVVPLCEGSLCRLVSAVSSHNRLLRWDDVCTRVLAARSLAFDKKYVAYRWDDDVRAAIPDWVPQFRRMLGSRVDLERGNGIVVGAGSGEEVLQLWRTVNAQITFVDVGERLVENCLRQMPGATAFAASAESLPPIGSATCNFYCALRTYQSWFLDWKVGLKEAFRVLCAGGVLVISLSDSYLSAEMDVVKGQIRGHHIDVSSATNQLFEMFDFSEGLGLIRGEFFILESEIGFIFEKAA